MKAARFLVLATLLMTALAGAARAQDDPLRHGHALLIGNAHYLDRRWPVLDDVPLQLQQLRNGLAKHFDSVDVQTDLDSDKLKQSLTNFLGKYGSDRDARLLIYYAGHGYTELIAERNENRGYITGIDTPWVDGATDALFDAARPKAVSMLAVRAPLEEVRAKSILFIFDSCFSGTIFADRGAPGTTPLTKDQVDKLLGAQARDIITAGTSTETVPAHSPIPDLLLAAIDGGADKYGWGVVSSAEIRSFMLDGARGYNLTPQEGPLRDSAFAGGSFLFRVIVPGVPATPESETLRRYREDAANGDANARVQLAYLYERGLSGLSKDEREAARLYKLAADQGNAWGQNDLGVFYRDARGGLPKDESEAARLFKLAADQGMTDAEVSLGVMYEQGRGGLPKDDREAARLYKLAADQGNVWGQANLGVFYRDARGGLPKDEREAARLFKLAADQGSAIAQVSLGAAYEQGLGGLPKDEREAARLYKLSADQGNAWGQNDLGIFYRDARGGLPKDEREAAGLFRLAADQQMTDAEVSLGALYEQGLGGLPKDEREAARLYKLAADQGNAWGQNNLGVFYRDGRGGLPKDEREAVRLFKLGADQGLAAAQASLGYCYEIGLGGLPKNDREAARLYKLSADQGNSYAQAGLSRLKH